MPYVSQERRKLLDPLLQRVAEALDSRGDLNYAVTALICSQIKTVGYASLEQAIGTLECAKHELYRRVAAPYEEKKCAENGDVYYDDTEAINVDSISDAVVTVKVPSTGRGTTKKRRDDDRVGGTSAVAP